MADAYPRSDWLGLAMSAHSTPRPLRAGVLCVGRLGRGAPVGSVRWTGRSFRSPAIGPPALPAWPLVGRPGWARRSVGDMYLLPKTETEARNTTVVGVLLMVLGAVVSTPALTVVSFLCLAFGVIGWVSAARRSAEK